MRSYDEVTNPKHYHAIPGLEAICIIESALSEEAFLGYLQGNAMKYRLRAGAKGDARTDLAKADWYAARAAQLLAARDK